MNLNELAQEVHQTAIEKGWWREENSFAQVTANIHGEVSEAWEEWRKGKGMTDIYCEADTFLKSLMPYPPDAIEEGYVATNESGTPRKPEGIPIEWADVIIRILDNCAKEGIDIEKAIRLKMEYNKTRSFRHGGKRA